MAKITETVDAFPSVTEEDVAMGMVSFCTPVPSRGKRRLSVGVGSEEPRPFWSQSRVEKSRIDATAHEKDWYARCIRN